MRISAPAANEKLPRLSAVEVKSKIFYQYAGAIPVSAITPTTLIRRKSNVVGAEIQGEVVALDIEGGDCYGFNPVASAVWELLEHTTTIDAICRLLGEQFEVEEDKCRAEVATLIRRLEQDGLVKEIQ